MFPHSRRFAAEIKAFDENLRRSLLMASDKIYDIMAELFENEFSLS
jgi:hypothetical protein